MLKGYGPRDRVMVVKLTETKTMRHQPCQHRAHVLYEALVSSGRHDAQTVARRGRISYDTLQKLWSGKRHILAEHLAAIYRGTGDVELYSALAGADDVDLLVCERKAVTSVLVDPVGAAVDVGVASGETLRVVKQALADGAIDDGELSTIHRVCDALERCVEELREVASNRHKCGRSAGAF